MRPFVRTVLIALFALVSEGCLAAPVDTLAARQAAERFLQQQARGARGAVAPLRLQRSTAGAHLFTAPGGAFVLTAATTQLPEILAYGQQGAAVPEAYTRYVDRLAASSLAVRTLASATPLPPVAPLMQARRTQGDPYNRLCPFYTYPTGETAPRRCPVGCVATAMEMVVSHYQRRITLASPLEALTTANYTLPEVPAGATLDTRLVLPRYVAGQYTDEQAEAVARLSLWLGMAARMNYGPSSSGSRLHRPVEALREAFGWGYVHYVDSYQYRPADYLALLHREIAAGRPVVYSGFDMGTSGHAFVLDGQDAEGFFHVNWGLNGDGDGYFRLDLLCVGQAKDDYEDSADARGFFCNQEALLLHPDAIDAPLPAPLARTGCEVEVEAVRFVQQPVAHTATRVDVTLRNTSGETLTTPFELFTNLPTDEEPFAVADYVALTGETLAPGERKTITVHAVFKQAGARRFRISADDEHLLCDLPVTVLPAAPAAVAVSRAALAHPAEGALAVTLSVTNASASARVGDIIFVQVYPLDDPDFTARTKARRFYLAPGEAETYTLPFSGLTPGRRYEVIVRQPWTERERIAFTQPTAATGLPAAPSADAAAALQYFTLDGRVATPPLKRGVYIARRGAVATKVFVP